MTVIGIVATIMLLVSAWLVGQKNRVAFILTILGELLWVYEAVLMERYDLVVLCVVFAVIAAHNWQLWGKKVSA